MNTVLIILFVLALTFLFGSTSGWVVHYLLHTKTFKHLATDHNVHHSLYTPDDFESEGRYRDAGKARSTLVFIPIITTAIAFMCIPLWFAFNAWWIYPIVLATGVFVGWLNDYAHYAFHIKEHWLNKYKYFRRLKYLHLLHHIHPKKNQGIIWFGADRLFRTFIDADSHSRRAKTQG
jgi:hypothetical protein